MGLGSKQASADSRSRVSSIEEGLSEPRKGLLCWLNEHYLTLILGAVGLATVVLSFLLEHHAETQGGWLNLNFPRLYPWVLEATQISDKLGEALVIASAIGLGVDPAIKIRLFDEVLTYAGLELWTSHLPAAVKRSVNELIGINLVRDHWTVEYKIVPAEKLLKITSTISGFVRNAGRRNDTIQLFAMVDPSMIQGAPDPEIVRMQAYFEGEPPIVNGKPEADIQADGTRATKQYPQTIMPGQSLFTLVQIEEYRPDTFILPLFTATTVASTMLTIYYNRKQIEVHVSTGTSDDIPATKTFDDCSVWTLSEPLLKGHCIQTRWSPVLEQKESTTP